MTVTPYNFKKPGRLHTALERQFQGWRESACALAARRWQREMPLPLELIPQPFDHLHAQPALSALSQDCVAHRVTLQDQLVTITAWPRRLALAVVGVLMGDLVTELPADRELTPVDESLFEFFLREGVLQPFLERWNGTGAIRPEVGERLVHPRFAKIFPADEGMLVAPFLLRGPFGEHEWRWLFPKKGLQVNLREEPDDAAARAAARQRLETQVRELPVQVTVRLGGAELPLSQLAQLQVGDLLMLDQRVNQPLSAQVEGREKLRGWPARVGNRQAFRIENWTE